MFYCITGNRFEGVVKEVLLEFIEENITPIKRTNSMINLRPHSHTIDSKTTCDTSIKEENSNLNINQLLAKDLDNDNNNDSVNKNDINNNNKDLNKKKEINNNNNNTEKNRIYFRKIIMKKKTKKIRDKIINIIININPPLIKIIMAYQEIYPRNNIIFFKA